MGKHSGNSMVENNSHKLSHEIHHISQDCCLIGTFSDCPLIEIAGIKVVCILKLSNCKRISWLADKIGGQLMKIPRVRLAGELNGHAKF